MVTRKTTFRCPFQFVTRSFFSNKRKTEGGEKKHSHLQPWIMLETDINQIVPRVCLGTSKEITPADIIFRSVCTIQLG